MMNIAIIGGGDLCVSVMDQIENHTRSIVPDETAAKVIAVADPDENAPGMVRAAAKGIFTTCAYHALLDQDDIDIIFELTGNPDVFQDIAAGKKSAVQVIDKNTLACFQELFGAPALPRKTDRELQLKTALSDIVMNDLIMDDAMLIGLDYRILDINESMLKRLGLTAEEAIGHFCYEITHHQKVPCFGENHPCPLNKTIEMKEHFQTTHIHLDRDGNEIHYSISCYPIFVNGQVIAALELSRDISRDIYAEKNMMQQEKLVSIGRLSAGVAHEINNPLTTILTSAMLIQEDLEKDDPNYQELELIANETLRCRKIVISLLDFARQTPPEKKYNNINAIIRESILLTQKQAAFKDISLKYVFTDKLPKIYIDKDQIQQSLINLIINAIEATREGGKITVTSVSIPEKEMIAISVHDTGEGIPEQQMDQIFEPFFTTKENGTGLGLAIIHGFVKRHGGALLLESPPGQGATFTIRLPVSKKDTNG